MSRKVPKQMLPPNAPRDDTRDLPLQFSAFHAPPLLNAKNVSSSYLKTEAQMWVARSAKAGAPTKKPKRVRADDAVDVPSASDDAADDGAGDSLRRAETQRLVIQLGSEYVRVGRATDPYPTTMPCVLARRMRGARSPAAGAPLGADDGATRACGVPGALGAAGTPPPADASSPAGSPAPADAPPPNGAPVPRGTPPAAGSPDPGGSPAGATSPTPPPAAPHIEMLRAELRAIMRQYKLRPVSNGTQSACSYNSSVEPETVPEHNDVYHVGWVHTDEDAYARTHAGHTDVLVGEEALRLAALSDDSPQNGAPHWELFRPWQQGLLDVKRYVDTYGASAAVPALLGDLQLILTHALAAAPGGRDDAAGDVPPSAGLGIPPHTFDEYAVLLLVPDAFSRSDLRALGTLLLTHMGFAALNVQTTGLCAIFGAGLSAACIVDIGATAVSISCVEEGLVLPETRLPLSYGGRDVAAWFGELLRASHFPYRALDAGRRLADAALLQSLTERIATLLPNQVGLNLYDFSVRLPAQPTHKYALRVYDEPILAALLLFHPRVARAQRRPRRRLGADARPAAVDAAGEEPVERDLMTSNMSLGGDEARELGADAPSDVAATLAMFAALGSRLPSAAHAALGTARVPAAASGAALSAADTASPAPDAADAGSARPSPAPGTAPGTGTATPRAAAVPVQPQTAAFASQALRCSTGAAHAAQAGIDVVEDASRTPLDRAVFYSLLASTGSLQGQLSAAGSEERLRRLANNVMCIGGCARLPGLADALEARVSMLLAEHYAPSDPSRSPAVPVSANFLPPAATVIPPPRNLDPELLAWKGLAVLAHLDSMQELWVYASDWATLGYRALKEKSLFL
ncbi:actin-like protein arp8 [Malassezia sp. CBS 17886]|nr:actin-like protein arp8 [Malassezia sp. CBS 17886]